MAAWSVRNSKDDETIEHFREKGPFYWRGHPKADINNELKEDDLAICCRSCNSSRSRWKLHDWFTRPYCKNRERPIDEGSVAEPVKQYIRRLGLAA